jgi:agmatine deiminase
VKGSKLLRRAVILSMALLLAGASAVPGVTESAGRPGSVEDANDILSPPLPRWRESGTPYNPQQSLYPYVVSTPRPKDMPTAGLIESTPEYEAARGVLFWYRTGHWTSVVRDLVVALTADPLHDEIAYVVVTSSSQMSVATSDFTAGGADMSKVQFIIEPGNSVWIRDYGPHFIWQDGALLLVDSHYYPTRPLDNFVPTLVGDDHFLVPTYDMGLYYSGGNFLPGPNRSAFVSALINLDNPASEGFDSAFIAELYQTYQGIDSLHVMPQLPFSVDGTGHIDMWMYLVDSNSVIISKFKEGSNATAIEITENAVPYMQSLGFEVYRTPAWNATHPDQGYMTHWTYTNAFRVNDRIFLPTYGETYPAYADEDAEALIAFQAAAGPEVEIVQIDCFPIIWAAGAIHCIVMQVPRCTQAEPAVHVVWPDGGELLISGTSETISWVATDTDNDSIPQIDLFYSTDGGGSWEFIATTANTGSYEWTVPPVATELAKVKVVATSADSDQGEAVSAEVFQISPGTQTVYDFTIGASADKFGYGRQTSSWSFIDGNRTPVSTEISTSAYDKIAYSDATGGDSDPNRYVSPDPSNNYESTHIFEFTIDGDPAEIDDIEILWEGYSDQCAQMEMYVWDYVEGQWSDGRGLDGQNRFMDNWAGNRDGFLKEHIRSNFDRYVTPSTGQMTLLLYSERGPDGYYVTYNPTFHDYVTITVSSVAPEAVCGDVTDNGEVDGGDVVYLINYLFKNGTEPLCVPITACADVNLDGEVNAADVVYLINYLYQSGPEPCNPPKTASITKPLSRKL